MFFSPPFCSLKVEQAIRLLAGYIADALPTNIAATQSSRLFFMFVVFLLIVREDLQKSCRRQHGTAWRIMAHLAILYHIFPRQATSWHSRAWQRAAAPAQPPS